MDHVDIHQWIKGRFCATEKRSFVYEAAAVRNYYISCCVGLLDGRSTLRSADAEGDLDEWLL